MDKNQLIQKAKDKAALELGWIDWVCFRADSDYLDQDTVIERAMEIYAQSLPTSPTRTVTDEEIAWGAQTELENNPKLKEVNPVEFMMIWRICAKWHRDKANIPKV